MKKAYSLILLTLLFLSAHSQQKWAIIKANAFKRTESIHGIPGVAAAYNIPAGRRYACTWGYNNKLYMFGGYGSTAMLADMWMFDSTTNNWTFLKGPSISGSWSVYGTMGVAAATNMPAGRRSANYWQYNGKFYMFGGITAADAAGSSGEINDLWMYDPLTNNWTWVGGSNSVLGTGSYGTMGVAAATNRPPARHGAVSWTYNDKFYLFGGVHMNDLWVYDPLTNMWTWLKGPAGTGGSAVFGTRGVAAATNRPGTRNGAVAWVYNHKLYLFGGDPGLTTNKLNDLWSYDPITNNWTWIKGSSLYNSPGSYGTMNAAAPSNEPPSRIDAAGWVLGGNLYLFGGSALSDLWKYDPVSGNWTWIKGTKNPNEMGKYTALNNFLPYNNPAGRTAPQCWVQNNRAYLLGGYGYDIAPPTVTATEHDNDDMWSYDMASNDWAWIKGYENPTCAGYSASGTLSTIFNNPEGRTKNVTWQMHDTIYVFGGTNYDDLWRYVITTNTWKRLRCTDVYPQPVVYGTAGVAAPANTPGGRIHATGWTHNGKLYLFGGRLVYGARGNDLWEYDPATNMWTWIKGFTTDHVGTYGTLGVAAAANLPRSRTGAVAYTYNNKFYLFGGQGPSGSLNDLWEYDPATNLWRWLKGTATPDLPGVYGTIGVASAATIPGCRRESVGWVCNNKFYLFGGWGWLSFIGLESGYLSDLWEYDPATNLWRWIKGRNNIYLMGVYGTMGTTSATSYPGPRTGASGMVYNNKLYLFGGNGFGYDILASGGEMNDLWQYDPLTGNWTWLSGANAPGQTGLFTTYGVAEAGNRMGARVLASAWAHNDLFYFWGGAGLPVNNAYNAANNDIWTYQPCALTACYSVAPTVDISVPHVCGSPATELNAANPGCTYLWSTGATTPVIYVTTPGTYSVTVTNSFGLSTTASTTILSTSVPVVHLGNDTSLCAGPMLTLDAGNPGSTYAWNTSASTQTIGVSTSGVYTVNVTSADGCSAADTIGVTFNSLPVVNLGADTGICAGEILALSSPGTVPGAYLWSTGGTSTGVSVSTAGSYWLRVTDVNGCVGRDTVAVTVNPLPVVALGSDISTCAGSTVVLDALNPGSDFLWSTIATTQVISPTTSGMYNVRVTNIYGCVGRDTINVTFNPLPVVNLGNDTSFCVGAGVVLNAFTAGAFYLWSTAATSSSIVASATGIYNVVVTNSYGCTGSDTVSITVNPLPSIGTISAVPAGGGMYNFSTSGVGATAHAWFFGDGSTSAIAAPLHTYSASGSYTVTCIVSNDCGSDTATYVFTAVVRVGDVALAQDVQVFPNPASEQVCIVCDAGNITSVRVTDIAGRLVDEQGSIDANHLQLNTAKWPTGIYQLYILTPVGATVRKLHVMK